MMSRLFSFAAVFFISCSLLAQQKVDSLLRIVALHQNNTQSFLAYQQLGKMMEEKDPTQAIAYYRHALQFSLRSDYSNNFVTVCNSLGSLYHLHAKYDSSLLVYHQAYTLAVRFNLVKEQALAQQGIGLNFLRQSMNDSARIYFDKSLNASVRINDLALQASGYNNLGNVAVEISNYKEAIRQYINAAKIYERTNDQDGLGVALSNIGNIQNILDQTEKAIEYTERALKIFEHTHNEGSLAFCYRLLGRIYRKQKNTDQALTEYKKALAIYHKTRDLRSEGETIQSLGNIYFDQHNFLRAVKEFEIANRIAKTIHSPSQLAYTYSGLGFAWHQLQNYDKALHYFDSSMVKAREVKNPYLIMDAYEVESNIYSELKNYKKALELHQLFSELKDSLSREENHQTVQELEAKYQNSQKQAEIELLKKDQQLQNSSLAQSRTMQTALITAFFLLLVIGVLFFNRRKIIDQANRQMEIERVRNQIARDLHDDMGSALSSINLISQVALNENTQTPPTNYFQRIREQSAKIMESMSDIVWSINPDNDTLQKTIARMKEFSAEILEPKNLEYTFKIDDSLTKISLNVIVRKNLFMIFKESLNNAAKYSRASEVHIHFSKDENNLVMTITDNGKGFDLSSPSSGNGLRNMKERSAEINSALSIESAVGVGTSLKLQIPLT
ncbi:MAG: tetratricopeptide repeat protein [Bacteroidetes bacterium]|nr:tetratricopeptide repeat protein [Bacteroidota bacterium]